MVVKVLSQTIGKNLKRLVTDPLRNAQISDDGSLRINGLDLALPELSRRFLAGIEAGSGFEMPTDELTGFLG